MFVRAVLIISICSVCAVVHAADNCVDCHVSVTPKAVSDWRASSHGKKGIGCDSCHGKKHKSASDPEKAVKPSITTCAACHKQRVEQYSKGKHSLAWKAMMAMPTVHRQPVTLIEGMVGCGWCHKIGAKTGACNSCHTRHTFSASEAKQPQACQTCHMGFDHPQWEMFSSSKHGIKFLLKQNKVLNEDVGAPSCQDCHMKGGDHGVRTAWGFLAVRMPMPEDDQWASDRKTILRALGVIDAEGNPLARMDAVRSVDMARFSEDDWRKERDKMIDVCSQCHSRAFASDRMKKSDTMIKEADRLMARAITIVAGLYEKGLLKKDLADEHPYPDLLAFHDAPSVIEQKLFLMFFEYRMRAFQGAFHNNPDYAFWYGWSELKQALSEIEEMARDMES